MPEVLTDEQLIALPDGDPLLGKLTSEEARRRTGLQLGRPPGSDKTRQDTSMIGVDHDQIQHGISNWASTLSPGMQKPAAMLAGFPADVAASLLELFSSPEIVGPSRPAMAGADMLARGASATAKAVPRMAGRGVGAVGDLVSPDLLGVMSPRLGKALELAQRMRAQAGTSPAAGAVQPRVAGKAPLLNDELVQILESLRAQTPSSVGLPGGNTWRAPGAVPSAPRMGAWSPDAPVTAPMSSRAPAAATPPAAPVSAPPVTAAAASPAVSPSTSVRAPRAPSRPPQVQMTAEESRVIEALVAEGHPRAKVMKAFLEQRQAAAPAAPSAPRPGASTPSKSSLVAAETTEYQRLRTAGKSHQEAMALIEAQRAFVQQKGLPTTAQTKRAVHDRNDSGRW